jgi:hypothetical protein
MPGLLALGSEWAEIHVGISNLAPFVGRYMDIDVASSIILNMII